MKYLKNILFFVLFVSVVVTFVFSDELRLKVTVSKANIRLEPTTNSQVVTEVVSGTVLDAIKKEGNWYYIKLPSDEKGNVVTGYIYQTLVEVIQEIEQKKEVKEEKPLKITQKVIRPKLFTDANYLKWKEDYFKAERDFQKAKKLIYFGLAGILGGGLVSGITGATAEGNYTGVLVGGGISFTGAVTWLYGFFKRSSASEKMHLLMNRGWINGYLGVWQRVGAKEVEKEVKVKEEVKEIVEKVVEEEKPKRIPSFPKELSFKVGGGIGLPLGDWAEGYNMGLGVNGSVILPVQPDIDFIGEVGYSRFGGKEKKLWGTELESSFSRFIFTGNGRYNFKGRTKLFAEAGLGFYYDKEKISIAEATFSETESNTRLGFRFGGGGIVMDKVELAAVFHLVENSNMFSISASYRF